ncbi:expressed unknown protein [Seminavis robusta]|uniref:Uncharacterized protein n=1 Tax=Seminavis robusta TaxID=568900 RepID=A0A9N8DQB7_9STRA|nr:expressed unknown protein [Seminavis robusta]|eukprot:Sro279_g106670.1 n/a (361) ;mRNA; r:5840-6922
MAPSKRQRAVHEADEEDEEEEEEWEEQDEDEDDEDFDDDSEESDGDNEAVLQRSLLWLCQEGQIQLAHRRFDHLMADKEQQLQLQREVFQVSRDKTTALTEILMGGTSDRNAFVLTTKLLAFSSRQYPQKLRHILSLQPHAANSRTALHWACWGNARMEILKPLVESFPEALLLRDAPRSGKRTPAEMFQHYHGSSTETAQDDWQVDDVNGTAAATIRHTNSQDRLQFLQHQTKRWIQHRLRNAIYLSMLHYFHDNNNNTNKDSLTPFDETDRKQRANKMRPKQWFILSVLGSLVQREMKPLAWHILGFVGGTARASAITKRKRKAVSSKQPQQQQSTATNHNKKSVSTAAASRRKKQRD